MASTYAQNRDLTSEQLNDLKELLAERIVDNMSTRDLVSYVQDDLFHYYEKLGEHDFYEEAREYWCDREQFEEIIEEIKSY